MATYKVDGDLNVTGNIYKDGVLDIPCEEIAYSALKAKRDAGELVPGRQYRITDYQCTTTTANTSSAGHQFDIIVVADSASVLNENARAALHAGDTYFASSNLRAWKLKYCLNNDTNLFAWADSTNGKGVIYRMIDEFNNDVPYDFKNILFTKSGAYTNAYTFSHTENNVIKDASLLGLSNACYDNRMKEYILSGKQQLNFNVFYSDGSVFDCYHNIFGVDCYSITFGYGCNRNTFGSSCHSITFGNSCYFLSFGNICANSSFGDDCTYNNFGDGCYSITFGENCKHNTFVGWCYSITFGENCNNIEFGIGCNSIAFGKNCYSITFGNGCSYIKFGNSSAEINYCKNIIVDNECKYLYINSSDKTASYSNQLQNIHIHLGVVGSSSANRLTITVPDRNLAYEITYEMTGSTTVTL